MCLCGSSSETKTPTPHLEDVAAPLGSRLLSPRKLGPQPSTIVVDVVLLKTMSCMIQNLSRTLSKASHCLYQLAFFL